MRILQRAQIEAAVSVADLTGLAIQDIEVAKLACGAGGIL